MFASEPLIEGSTDQPMTDRLEQRQRRKQFHGADFAEHRRPIARRQILDCFHAFALRFEPLRAETALPL